MSTPTTHAPAAPDPTATYGPHINGVFSMRILPLILMRPVVVFGAGLFGFCIAGGHWSKIPPVKKDNKRTRRRR